MDYIVISLGPFCIDFIVYRGLYFCVLFLKQRRWHCPQEEMGRSGVPIQFSAGNYIICTNTNFAVSHISCTVFPLADTVDNVILI